MNVSVTNKWQLKSSCHSTLLLNPFSLHGHFSSVWNTSGCTDGLIDSILLHVEQLRGEKIGRERWQCSLFWTEFCSMRWASDVFLWSGPQTWVSYFWCSAGFSTSSEITVQGHTASCKIWLLLKRICGIMLSLLHIDFMDYLWNPPLYISHMELFIVHYKFLPPTWPASSSELWILTFCCDRVNFELKIILSLAYTPGLGSCMSFMGTFWEMLKSSF